MFAERYQLQESLHLPFQLDQLLGIHLLALRLRLALHLWGILFQEQVLRLELFPNTRPRPGPPCRSERERVPTD